MWKLYARTLSLQLFVYFSPPEFVKHETRYNLISKLVWQPKNVLL